MEMIIEMKIEKKYKLTVRLNEDDYRKLKYQSDKLEKNKTEAIREFIRKERYLSIKELNFNLKELLIIKRSIANSLNQISKKLNSNSLQEFQKIKKELDELWLSLNQ